MQDVKNYFQSDISTDYYFSLSSDNKLAYNHSTLVKYKKSYQYFNPHLKYIFFWFLMTAVIFVMLLIHISTIGKGIDKEVLLELKERIR